MPTATSPIAARILALQRSAGNQAVVRLLAATASETGQTSVQRALGFEFETNVRTAKLPPGTPQLAPVLANWSNYYAGATNLDKGDKILTGGHFTAEADEFNHGLSDLEFVTSLPAFPETKKGRDALIATMTDITGMADMMQMNKGAARRGFQATEFGAFGSPKMKNVVFTPPMNGPVTAAPQSTAAVRLGQLGAMMRQIGTPTGVGGALAPAADPLDVAGKQDLMGMSAGDQDVVGESVAMADAAVVGYPAWLGTKGLPQVAGSAELTGLIALVLTYILRGDREQLSYAKNISIMLARTNFATMFKQLTKAERKTFSRNKGADWADFVLSAASLGGTENTPVFVNGLNYDVNKKQLLDDITRGKWLKGMAMGIDVLTSKKVGSGRGAEMESLGRLGTRTEKVGVGGAKTSAPIFEFRRMPNAVVHTEWAALALNVFDYVRKMNNLVHAHYKQRNNAAIKPST